MNSSNANEVGALVGDGSNATVINSFSTSVITSTGGVNIGGLIGLGGAVTNSVLNTTESVFYSTSHPVYNGAPPWDYGSIWVSPNLALPTLLQ